MLRIDWNLSEYAIRCGTPSHPWKDWYRMSHLPSDELNKDLELLKCYSLMEFAG